jgi:hypothetical protein
VTSFARTFHYWQNLKKMYLCWCSPLLHVLFSWTAKIYGHLSYYILQLKLFITLYSICTDIGRWTEPHVFCRYWSVKVWCPSYSSRVMVEWKHTLNTGIQLCMAWNLYQYICSWHLLFMWGLDLYVNRVLRLLIFLLMQSFLYYDVYWATQHLAFVWVGCFTMYVVQCYPVK